MGKKDELKNRLHYALELRDKKASDLSKDLSIPKSAISQYLNGKSKNMTADRLNAIGKYLNVSEAWLMGYDVSMDRTDGINYDSKDDVLDPMNQTLLEQLSRMSLEEKEELLNYIQFIISKRKS